MTDVDASHPAFLVGYFVCEVGVRQAWPFVTFAHGGEPEGAAEPRLYIDSTFTVHPPPPGGGLGDEDDTRLWLLRLAELLNLTVESVIVEADHSLSMIFGGGVTLKIDGQGAPWTVHEVWWLGQLHR